MTAEQVELAARQRAAMLNFARSYRRRGIHVTVDENSTQQELADFTTEAITAVVAADRRIQLTRDGLDRATEYRRAAHRSTALPKAKRSRRSRRSTRSRVSASDDGPGEPPPATCAGCTLPTPTGASWTGSTTATRASSAPTEPDDEPSQRSRMNLSSSRRSAPGD